MATAPTPADCDLLRAWADRQDQAAEIAQAHGDPTAAATLRQRGEALHRLLDHYHHLRACAPAVPWPVGSAGCDSSHPG